MLRHDRYWESTSKHQVNLIKDHLPNPPRVTAVWGSLARPQPDSCIGYIKAAEAMAQMPALAMPFICKEDDMADGCAVLHTLYDFP